MGRLLTTEVQREQLTRSAVLADDGSDWSEKVVPFNPADTLGLDGAGFLMVASPELVRAVLTDFATLEAKCQRLEAGLRPLIDAVSHCEECGDEFGCPAHVCSEPQGDCTGILPSGDNELRCKQALLKHFGLTEEATK